MSLRISICKNKTDAINVRKFYKKKLGVVANISVYDGMKVYSHAGSDVTKPKELIATDKVVYLVTAVF